jgi:hypothetical protein
MLMEYAPPRPKPVPAPIPARRLCDRKRITPPWVKQESRLLLARRAP